MEKKIAVIKGDGIGPEIVCEAQKVLDKVGEKFGHVFNYTDVLMGGIAIDKTGVPLPQETIDVCLASDSVLLGAVGGPKWDTLPGNLRPEAGLLGIRGALKLFANIRPAKLIPALAGACPLKEEITKNGLDL
ncbi:MAG: 3-isopropylmalate dehydrogenase, partial [Oscillospiraceae bacterium]|nr:3-isopropylmalate dehydrogenase [Oscillospiraceae bacterium]